jgi:hypothetical protein
MTTILRKFALLLSVMNSRNSHSQCPDPVLLVCEDYQAAQGRLEQLVLPVHKVQKVVVVNLVLLVTMVQLVCLVQRDHMANVVNVVLKGCPFVVSQE